MSAPARRPDATVVLPTFNEAGSLPKVIRQIRKALAKKRYEILVVDDNSPDGTAAVARRCRARVLLRKNKRGLASAIWDGIWASRADVVLVMDADGQHDAKLLPLMAEELMAGRADVVVGSRYARGGSGFEDGGRKIISAGAALLARPLTGKLSDPMSGFFGLRRNVIEKNAGWKLRGFKLLPELLARQPGLRVKEYPLMFGKRLQGKSKMNAGEVAQYARLVLELYARRLMERG